MQVKNWQNPKENNKQKKSPAAPKKVRRTKKRTQMLRRKLKNEPI